MKFPKTFTKNSLYEPQEHIYSKFDLYVIPGEVDLDAILKEDKPALKLDVGHEELQNNSIQVYGKDLMESGRFKSDAGGEQAYQEFQELVELISHMDAGGSYRIVELPELEKTQA